MSQSELGVDGESRLYRGPCVLDPPKVSQSGGKKEVNEGGDIPVRFDRSRESARSGLVGCKIGLCNTSCRQPAECPVVTGGKPKCLHDTGFRFLSSAEIALPKSNPHISGGEISIQHQCMLTFGDTLGGAFGKDPHDTEEAVGAGVVWHGRNYLGQSPFGCHEARGPVAGQHEATMDEALYDQGHRYVPEPEPACSPVVDALRYQIAT
ncbi:hypothetical protein [Bradyrhizobium sp. USDA 3256]